MREKRAISWFDKNIEWKLGDGRKLRFWHNTWLGNAAFVSKYKRLFLNSCQKETLVGDIGKWEVGIWRWRL